MQPSNQNDLQARIAARFRTLLILWFALLISIGLYYVMTLLKHGGVDTVPNPTLSVGLVLAGSVLVISSVLIKHKFLSQAVEQQRLDRVQTAHIVAWALCEVAAMLGLLEHFLTGNRYYYVLFMIAACGMLLNFPRRQHIQDACFKGPGF
jgi:hypothetical protein